MEREISGASTELAPVGGGGVEAVGEVVAGVAAGATGAGASAPEGEVGGGGDVGAGVEDAQAAVRTRRGRARMGREDRPGRRVGAIRFG
jgi:hypothetical protein